MSFWNRLETVCAQHNVLRHPFFVRWAEGTLRPAELADYSGQYRHAVIAFADAAAAAARSHEAGADARTLGEHAAEEAAHVGLWDEFVAAAGGQFDAEPTTETRDFAAALVADESRPLPETLLAMYAIESAYPAIATTERVGLAEHYGIDATAYFDVHEGLDVEHAAQMRELINARLADADQDSLLATAEQVLSANWRLLDGVEALTRA
jgi:pyrroloquinoline quinone (PQQ) biosynthesis protein C